MKKISAKILITQLVILCITLFIFPMKVKADEVSYPFFLYNVRHTYEEDNSLLHPFRHKYEFYIHANHEVTGRFIISVTTGSGTTSHTWFCESGGEIYNNAIMDRSTGTTVLVTGQQYLKLTLMYMSDSPIDIMNVRSIQFSQTDLDGNPITTDQSLWSEVQKIEDHTFQLLGAVGFINDNLTDVRSKLQSVITLMTTTNSKLDTLITSATNILTKVTSIDTALQNIDNTIDIITWNNITDFNFLGASLNYSNNDNENFSLSNVYGKKVYIGIILPLNVLNQINLLKLSIPYSITHYDQIEEINILSYGNPVTPVYWNGARNHMDVYFNLSGAVQTNRIINIEITFKTNQTIYYQRSYVTTVNNINPDDIEYWNLLGFLNQYEFYNQQLKDNKSIIEKLSELILGNNTTNNSVINNDQSNQQFNQQQQQYDQIESTFQSSFTTDQQAVQQTFNNNTLTIFADTTLWFTQQLNALYNASGQMKILFTMPLLLGLALFFIGRGAKTSAPNTIDSYYSSEQTANVDGVKYYRVRRTSGAHKVFHGFNRK